MALASWAGVFVEGVYAKEAPYWATQGVGQDIANLFVVLPVMVVSAWLAGRGSFRAVLVLAGALLYVVYSYLVSDIAVPAPMIVVVGAVTLISLALAVAFLRRVGAGD